MLCCGSVPAGPVGLGPGWGSVVDNAEMKGPIDLEELILMQLIAAYFFMNALALAWLVVKVRPLCSRGSANIVEAGVLDSDLIVLHVRVWSGLFSRSAVNSSNFVWRAG